MGLLKKISAMRFLRVILVSAFFCILGCSKESADLFLFDLDEGEVQLQYAETQCADPWFVNESYASLNKDQKVSRMVSFLEQQGINVLAASYIFNEDGALACLACTCQTGGMYYVKVLNKPEVIEQLRALNFELI
jgi:hypothetical protein